ncbi:unnamed protein product [Owenia fusiformis]|uniref:Metalloendopeptidase n=1 Tax=Owenia fusiformis TaxID=6347 RepID=A0A8S4PGF0_OWEFU|nr:unnamed protein product [Owenia fusiformis]
MKEIKKKHMREQDPTKHRVKRKMLRRFDSNETWTFPIKVYIDPKFDDDTLFLNAGRTIRKALKVWADKTCVSFTEVSSPTTTSGIFFKSGTGCTSTIGKAASDVAMNEIVLKYPNCFSDGNIQRQIGHALGLVPEFARPDRDSYVEVQGVNTRPGMDSSFLSFNWFQSLTENVEYDYGSVMQDRESHFARPGTTTLLAKFSEYQNTMGQKAGLSFSDVKIFNYQYCSETCPGYCKLEWSECKHGGYRDPLNCDVCRCPDGWSGPKCETLQPATNAVCGGIKTVDSTPRTLQSPGYPTPGYVLLTSCTWLLQAPPGQHVNARVVGDFETDCASTNSPVCDHDWLEIRYADLGHTGPRYCCTGKPSKTFVSVGNEMMILLRSNDVFVGIGMKTGFQLEYFSTTGDTNVPCKYLKLKDLDNREQKWREGIFKKLAMPWNSKPVYKHLYEPEYMYYESGDWVVGPVIGGTTAGVKIQSNAASPDEAIGTWKSYRSEDWLTEPRLSLTCSDLCDRIWLSGISKQSTYNYLNGAYTLFEIDTNGAPVYKRTTSSDGVVTLNMIGGNKWQLKSDSHTLVSPFTTIVTNPTKIPNTWSIDDEKIKIECYFGPSPCDSIMVSGIKDYQANRMGLYFPEGPLYNGRPMYKHESGDHVMYHNIINETRRYWIIGPDMKGAGGVMITDTAMVPENINADTWQLFDGDTIQWIDVNTGSASCANLVFPWWRRGKDKRFRRATTPCEKLFMTGGDLQLSRKGVYTLQTGTLNSRPVYEHESENSYLYYGTEGWSIGASSGAPTYGVIAIDPALLPYAVVETWEVFNGVEFVDDPAWTVSCFQAPSACNTILFDDDPRQQFRQGLYFLEAETFNDRPVYQHESDVEFLFYNADLYRWFIGPEIGGVRGGVYSIDPSLTPEAVSTTWFVAVAGGSWVPAPKLSARCYTVGAENNCPKFFLGGYPSAQLNRQGVFSLSTKKVMNRAVYDHEGGREYLYYSKPARAWTVGSTPGSSSVGIKGDDTALTLGALSSNTKWSVVIGGKWAAASTLKGECMSDSQPCATLYIGGVTWEQTVNPNILGVYVYTGSTSGNRPVYKSEKGQMYLYYLPQYGLWVFYTTVGVARCYIKIADTALHPEDITASLQECSQTTLSGMNSIAPFCFDEPNTDSCDSLQVTGFSVPHAQYNGRYTRTGTVVNYRASYKQTGRNLYLYYKFGLWLIGDTLDSGVAGVKGETIEIYPQRATKWEKYFSGWKVESTAKVTC